jgi:hypothetical protein
MRCRQLFLPIGLLFVGLMWGSCVDIPSDPGTNVNPNFRSMVRFIHAVPGGPTGNITVDAASVATGVAFPSATPYLDIASGSRSVAFGSTAAQTVNFASEQQSTALIYSTGTGVAYLNLPEGHKDKNNGAPGVALVRFVNVAQGSAANISLTRDSVKGAPLSASLGFGKVLGYTSIAPGAIPIYAVSNGSYTVTLNGPSEVPATTSTSTGSGTVSITPDSLIYSIDVKSDNSQGFYTGAHFHNAAVGVAGPVVDPIDVTGQKISIPDVTLSGANEVPAVGTSATAKATFTLTRAGLVYSVTAVRDTVDTLFTMAHFHHGAAGVNGPIWHFISDTAFGSTTLKGTWTGAAIGDTLTQLLAGNIYVNMHSVAHPGGVIRAQLVPDAFTTNTYSGSWKGSTLTDALKQELNNGNLYVNFHTAANPSGQIRGQVTSVEQYGVYSLPSATYQAGLVYTIVASGAGSTFQLVKYSDRQYGLSKARTVTGKSSVPQSSK